MYSRENIKQAICDGKLKIYPFEEKNLTGIGYNISTTNFAFSVNRGVLLKVYKDTIEQGYVHYVKIPPQDTVLFFSKELIETDKELAGTFQSKVSRVSQGLGHISTTLDAMWKGQLIISVNNPTDRVVRFDLDRAGGNIMTLIIHKLDAPIEGSKAHDNNQGRCDLLLSHFTEKTHRIFRKWRRKHLELEEFIIHEFANSLNGDDNFLEEEGLKDKYTEKIAQLKKLKERLENNLEIIREDRYQIGKNGEYKILRNFQEEKIIKECTLFPLFQIEESKLSDAYKEENVKNERKDILKRIELYLYIIAYELETINHKRRVLWQNRKIEDYASETPRLERMRLLKKIALNVAAFALIFAVFFIALHFIKVDWANDIESLQKAFNTIVVTVISGFVLFLLKKGWDKLKNIG